MNAKRRSREEWKGTVSDGAATPAEEVLHEMRALVGRKWHPIIIYYLLDNGPMGFNDLKEDIDGISSKMLSEGLTDLEEKQLIERDILSEKPVRIEYSLTARGRSFGSVVMAMIRWGRDH